MRYYKDCRMKERPAQSCLTIYFAAASATPNLRHHNGDPTPTRFTFSKLFIKIQPRGLAPILVRT